jgi:hypothetical protein
MADVTSTSTWTILSSLNQWQQLQQQFAIYQTLCVVVLPLIIIALVILFWPAMPFFWARFVTHEPVICLVDRLTREIKPDNRFRKKNGVLYFHQKDMTDPKRKKRYFPQLFIKVYEGNFYFAGYPWDLVDADVKVLEDPRFKKACDQLKSEGYPTIEALERAVLFSSMIPKDREATAYFDPRLKEWMNREGFKNYDEMEKKINPKKYTIETPLVKQFFVACPITDFLGYGTDIPESDINGECHDIYESKKPQEAAKRKLAEMLPLIVIIIAVCAVATVAVVWLGI